MQEFIYYSPEGLDFPLSEQIFVASDNNFIQNQKFLISNSKNINSELVSQEIDFYIKNSQDNISDKIKNVLKLYELSAIKYDFAQDIFYSQELTNTLLLITNSKEEYEEFVSKINASDFELYTIDATILKDISGQIGNLAVTVDNEGKDTVLNVSQVVWFDSSAIKSRSGVYNVDTFCIDEVLSLLKSNINSSYKYKKFTTYNETICQYNERRVEICSKCEDICPSVAITKDDEKKKLTFSQIDCIDCGKCISVCPSGALDNAAINKTSFHEISKFYTNKHPLIIVSKGDISFLDIPLKQNVFPLVLESQFLDEATLLTLLQLSGSQIAFYSDFTFESTNEVIQMLNNIYQKKFNKDAILVANNLEELGNILEEVSYIENSYFNFNQNGLKKREIFSTRLQKIVENDDLGVITTGSHIHYGTVKVNEANCTLCLSCVGACNVDALIANEADFSLRINPSLCTACGYCEVSCPEKDCLTIVKDEIELQPLWFKENILAKDKLFACVECGKEFATAKAIEKIAAMMAPIFAKVSETKKRTLYCCEDCKAKLMIKQGLLDA